VGKVKVDIKTSPQDIYCTPPGALQQKLQIFAAESQEMLLATQGGRLIDQNSHCVVVTLGLNFKPSSSFFPSVTET
jgi:hypothetical protein